MTTALILSTAAIWVAYDLYAGFTGDEPMITDTFRGWAQKYPSIPFACGMLAGHFFWVN